MPVQQLTANPRRRIPGATARFRISHSPASGLATNESDHFARQLGDPALEGEIIARVPLDASGAADWISRSPSGPAPKRLE